MADAAAAAGEPRYTKDFLLPMRPIKLRLVEEMQTSPSPIVPECSPRHAPQVAGVIALAPHIFVEDLTLTSIEQARTAYQKALDLKPANADALRQRLSKQ